MTLQNLERVGQLHPHEPTPAEIRRLLASVENNLNDAALEGNSAGTRFDCAYRAVMQCALIALMANGYRPATNATGHHRTMIQSLPLTLGIAHETWIVLDALRKKRNQVDYGGAEVAAGEIDEAIVQSRNLLSLVRAYLRRLRPELL